MQLLTGTPLEATVWVPRGVKNATLNNLPGRPSVVLPDGFDGSAPSENERVMAFCGGCQYFDSHPLGGGGDCQKGHEPRKQAARDHCPDRVLMPVSGGPQFDMSE